MRAWLAAGFELSSDSDLRDKLRVIRQMIVEWERKLIRLFRSGVALLNSGQCERLKLPFREIRWCKGTQFNRSKFIGKSEGECDLRGCVTRARDPGWEAPLDLVRLSPISIEKVRVEFACFLLMAGNRSSCNMFFGPVLVVAKGSSLRCRQS